jgi:LmbE family N-acetylglucosaminyl deacetylase
MIIFALIVMACGAVAVALCGLRVRAYRSWLGVPSDRKDVLHCRLTDTTFRLHLKSDGFQIPAEESLLGRTVLLELQISTSLLGGLLDPFIEISRGGVTYRQYFERGAHGQRFVDVSPLFRSASAGPSDLPVHLAGTRIRWRPEGALRAFKAPRLTDATVLIVAPHPDDAEIAAFGVYATHRSWIVTITAGERGGGAPGLGMSAPESLLWAARLRVADSLAVPQLGKVRPERCVNLAYADGALESMYRQPAQSFRPVYEPSLPRSELRSLNPLVEFRSDTQCTWNNLIDELAKVLELSKPDVVICPHPRLDKNLDHVFTTRAVELAIRKTAPPPPLFLLYAVHCAGAPTYPYGPAAALSGLPANGSDAWLSDSIYSHFLEPELRRAKYFALESMHAVRANRLPLKPKVLGLLAGLGTDPTSFLRRAPRPTEMYYVLSGDYLSQWVHSNTN